MEGLENSSVRWRPLPLDFFLEKYRLKERKVLVLLGLWIVFIGLSVFSVLQLTSFFGSPFSLGNTTSTFFLFYPPLLLGTLLVFWLGFEWGFIPVFLSAFLVAFFSLMPYYWAVLFAIAFVLGLAIYALVYYCIPFDPGLSDFKSFVFFTVVSFVAAIASSLGSFVWSLYHDLGPAETLTLWKAWWTGSFFQSMVLVAPLLYFFTPTLKRVKNRYFDLPEPQVNIRWIYSAIISVVAVLLLFIVGAKMLGSLGLEQDLASLHSPLKDHILKARESYEIVSWISIGLVLLAGLGGIYLVGSWNQTLKEQVDFKTDQLKRSEASLTEALEEKDTLLKQIHHRVNDNLTLVLALLELQFKNSEKGTISEVLKDSHARIRSLAVIYETMYESESMSEVNLKNYTVKLSNRLRQSYKKSGQQIDVSINASEVKLPIDRAVPFAMILNELMVNAYVHAFKKMTHGTIFVELKRTDGEVALSVRDNGTGLPGDFNLATQKTLGMRLIHTLTRQLHGEFSVEGQEKTAFSLKIPVEVEAAA